MDTNYSEGGNHGCDPSSVATATYGVAGERTECCRAVCVRRRPGKMKFQQKEMKVTKSFLSEKKQPLFPSLSSEKTRWIHLTGRNQLYTPTDPDF
jgi:hypothetical protein